jgi:hypothetical protein
MGQIGLSKDRSAGMIHLLAMVSIAAAAGTIDRNALVTRHHVVLEKVRRPESFVCGQWTICFQC